MKKKSWKKLICSMLALAMLMGTLAGCGSKEETVTPPAKEEATEETAPEAEPEAEGVTYPAKENVTLTIAWMDEAPVTANAKNIAETPFGKAWQEATGVTLEVIQVADREAMNLLFASGDLPDMIYYDFPIGYAGGTAKAIKDKIIQPLNDYMQFAPDFQAVLDSNEAWKKGATTNDGDIVGFPMFRNGETLKTTAGMIIRNDWLEDLGLEVPKTPDELISVLKAFKDEKGATAPLTGTNYMLNSIGVGMGVFTSPFGLVAGDFYQVDGKVHWGRTEAEYKEVLTFLNKLYNEGLLDPNFSTIDGQTMNANMMNGVSGLSIGALGGQLGTYMNTMAETDPEYEVIGIRPLVAKAEDTPMSTHYSGNLANGYCVITSACKDVEAAVKFLNYGYTEEGSKLFNFGIEGESYTMEGGKPTYTEYVQHNPDGLSKQFALAQYTRAWQDGPFVQEEDYILQYSNLPQQTIAIENWTDSNAVDHAMPPIVIADDETAEYTKLKGDADTYIAEMYVKYVSGLESLDTFESEYLATLEKLQVNRIIEIQQNALDAYNAR